MHAQHTLFVMKRLAPSAATAAAVKRPALAASASAASAAQQLMPADDPKLKFHKNWVKKYPQYTQKVHEQMQQLLAEVGNVPDELALSDKDAKAKEYFDTGAEINIQRRQHEGKQMAMLQMFDQLPQQEDMDNFEKYVNAAHWGATGLRPNGSGHSEPLFALCYEPKEQDPWMLGRF